MIDSHTHIWMESQLKQAAVFGVTTELDMMSIPENVAVFRKQQSDGKANDRADVFSAGAAVTVVGGHGISMHQELRMLVSAGLTNEQALSAATSNPAKHFKLADRGQIMGRAPFH